MPEATQIISDLKLHEVIDKYTPFKHTQIGNGSYGIVYKFQNKLNNKPVAIKFMDYASLTTMNRKRIYREIKLLQMLKGNSTNNIVGLQDVIISEENGDLKGIALVFDYHETNLHSIITSRQLLTGDHCSIFIYQILVAMEYMHSANIVHRDVKPSNILVNSDCQITLCDLGLSRALYRLETDVAPTSSHVRFPLIGQLTKYVVTRWYRAPEIVLGQDNYGFSSDMWSVGCILAELILRKPLFPAENEKELFKLIFSTLGTPDEESCRWIDRKVAFDNLKPDTVYSGNIDTRFPQQDTNAIDLVKKLLCFDPQQRLTAKQALQHPFVIEHYTGSHDFLMSSLNNVEQTLLQIYYNFEDRTEACSQSTVMNRIIDDLIKEEVAVLKPPEVSTVFNLRAPSNVRGTLYSNNTPASVTEVPEAPKDIVIKASNIHSV